MHFPQWVDLKGQDVVPDSVHQGGILRGYPLTHRRSQKKISGGAISKNFSSLYSSINQSMPRQSPSSSSTSAQRDPPPRSGPARPVPSCSASRAPVGTRAEGSLKPGDLRRFGPESRRISQR